MNTLSSQDALPRRRPHTAWMVGGIVAMVMLLVLGTVAGLAWFSISTFNDQAYTAIRADPAIVDAVGKIAEIHFDFEATGNALGDDEFAYRIIGDRASGLLVGRFVTIDAESEELREGTLILDDRRVITVGTARSVD